MATYVAEPKAIGDYCHFGDQLSDMLHDRFVWVSMTPGYRHLLQESTFTFNQAFETSQAMEVADCDIKDIQLTRTQYGSATIPVHLLPTST